ncbi:fluoride efflux transporter FluC [Halobacillus sp. B23F22_1]|uniref:fluoride efflux transporter FluC n=1 Tax=Halobacillus sp. B23F22_1 TaxID=3459514 RepID=UPI00373E006B
MSVVQLLLVGAGGCAGAILRFAFSQFVNKNYSFQLPAATLIVNLAGSFCLGLIVGTEASQTIYLLFGTGVMGSLTTFSTFKLEGIQLHLDKKWKTFVLYQVISYGGGISLAFLGYFIGRML